MELGNISTRLKVGSGNDVLIGGFIITGTQPKKVILRGLGTSLGSSVSGVLADPFLELHGQGGNAIASNDDWRTSNEQAIIDSGFAPPNAKESAILITLQPGLYTAILSGVNGSSGIGLVEVYDLDPFVDAKLGNLSTRGLVETGANVMIGGLIVQGDSDANLVIRAIGPSLPITGALQDPVLELYDANANLIRSNDNWKVNDGVLPSGNLAPTDDAESAIVATLSNGAYTAIVRGANDTSGIALVEVYQLP